MYRRTLFKMEGSVKIFIVILMACLLFPAIGIAAAAPELYLQLGYRTGDDFNRGKEIVFSQDGQLLAAVSGGASIKIWQTSSGREVATLTGHSAAIKNLAFLPDGRRIVSGSNDRTLKLWDISSGRLIRSFQGHRGDIRAVAVSNDGALLASAESNAVKVWELDSGRLLASIAAPGADGSSSGYIPPVMALIFSPDSSKLIFANIQSSLFIVDLRQQRIVSAMTNRQLDCYTNLSLLGFDPEGRLIAGSLQTLLFVDLERAAAVVKKSKKEVWIEYSAADGSFVAGPSHPKASFVRVLDANLSERLAIPQLGDAINRGYSPAAGLAAASFFDNQLRLFDLTTGKELQNFGTKALTPRDGSFSVDGSFVSLELDLPGKASGTTVVNRWNLKNAQVEKIVDRREQQEKVLQMFKSNDQQQHQRAIKMVEAEKFYEVPKDYFSEYDDLNRCFYAVEEASLMGYTPTVNIYRITAAHKDDTEPKYSHNRPKWKVAKQFRAHQQNVTATAVSYAHRYIATGSEDMTINLFSFPAAALIRSFKGHHGKITKLVFSADGSKLLSQASDQTTRLWDIASGRELGRFISFSDGEWLVITPEGYYNASPNGDKYLNVRVGTNVYGIENYREAFFRPDLVKLALSGGSLQGYRTLADIKQPPRVSIVQTAATSSTEDFKLTLKLEEQGGGVGDIRLFLNGSAVLLDSARSLKAVQKDNSGASYRSYTLKLAPGSNSIRALAFNADNSMQSNETVHQVTASFASTRKPTLHALVVGINSYKNPKLTLQYAVADALLFADTLKKTASGLFDKVVIKTLTTRETTSAVSIARELKALRTISPDDLFVLYVASHGVVDDGEYYLITSNVGLTRTEKLKTDALTQTALKELIANIPTTKKLIVLDTCNAAAAGDAIQVAMLTRGMSEDTAMKILSRAVGSTILSASTSSQEALEGYQGHGLFTWVLAEGLKGKADKAKSGYVKTTDIADYVGEEVPNLAERVFKRAQYPTISMSGQPFPVGKVR